jgi:hypothetical protein
MIRFFTRFFAPKAPVQIEMFELNPLDKRANESAREFDKSFRSLLDLLDYLKARHPLPNPNQLTLF